VFSRVYASYKKLGRRGGLWKKSLGDYAGKKEIRFKNEQPPCMTSEENGMLKPKRREESPIGQLKKNRGRPQTTFQN